MIIQNQRGESSMKIEQDTTYLAARVLLLLLLLLLLHRMLRLQSRSLMLLHP